VKRIVVPIILFVAVSGSNAHAFFSIGNDLVSDMREWKSFRYKSPNTDYQAASAYRGYVTAVYDVYDLKGIICPDNENVTVGQVNAIVAKYLNNNPERWSEPALYLVADALKLAFPCSV